MGSSRTYDIVEEPTGLVYVALLEFALDQSDRFTLVWQPQLDLDDHAAAVEANLRAFLADVTEATQWPGTTLLNHHAIVRSYRSVPQTLSVLAAAGRLYAWQAPSRPEDLTFYANGVCWLGSIAHERDAFVVLDDASIAHLRGAVPALKLTEHLNSADADGS